MEKSPFESSFVQQLLARRRFGVKPGLDVTRAIMAELGDPQRSLKFVHVAGTNGKGAVCALLDSILRAAGLRPFVHRRVSCNDEGLSLGQLMVAEARRKS